MELLTCTGYDMEQVQSHNDLLPPFNLFFSEVNIAELFSCGIEQVKVEVSAIFTATITITVEELGRCPAIAMVSLYYLYPHLPQVLGVLALRNDRLEQLAILVPNQQIFWPG